jgi:phytoene dehydrogenase-like protein
MSKSILIIGGGIAGLAAGCYAQMNGYRSQVFEMHTLPGGLCTAWERGPYVFDGCIHYLFGSGEGQPFNRVWHELGAVTGRKMINHDELMRIKGSGGQTLIVYSDPDQLEQHMCALSPADAKLILAFAQGIRDFETFDMSLLFAEPRSLLGPFGWASLGMKLLPFVPPVLRWALVSAQDFGKRFRDPFLREAVPHLFAWPDIPVLAGLSMLAYMHTKNAGFPIGASLDFARAIEKRYLDLGGEIHYKAEVSKILVDGGDSTPARAAGIRLYSDEEYRADYVISAADGRGTVYDLLGGRFLDGGVKKRYDGHLPIRSQFQVSLGVARDMSQEPHWVTYLLQKPLVIADDEHHEIQIKHYCFDPSLAPTGKSVVEAMLPTRYNYWQRIHDHRLYDSEQSQVSGIVIGFLEKLYPGMRDQIEVVDEATPLSYERYTGNWRGSSCGWLLTKSTLPAMILGMPKTLPGLHDLYLAGQWVEPGGSVPMAAMSGRNALQLICRQDHRTFVTSTAPEC